MPIRQTWDGVPVGDEEAVDVGLVIEKGALVMEIDAPFHDDPPPPTPPGSMHGLWEYEVVELFLLGRDERYLEIELGPHGHYLGLELEGIRRVVRSGFPIVYRSAIRGERWRGTARVPAAHLPPDLARANAYAIHGRGVDRRHLAWRPVPGGAPDFHRLDCFGPLAAARDDRESERS